jgi:serine protease AprX
MNGLTESTRKENPMRRSLMAAARVALVLACVVVGLSALGDLGRGRALAGGGRAVIPPGDTVGSPTNDPGFASVLIRSPRPYEGLVARIEMLGGHVTRQFRHLDAVAARLPSAALGTLGVYVGPAAISKDAPVRLPDRVDDLRGREVPLARTGDEARIAIDASQAIGGAAELADLAVTQPDSYLINGALMGLSGLHASGLTGDGVIVAVIDSGLRPGFPHLELDGSILGGEDFVGDGLGWMNTSNSGHGTFVAGMVSANLMANFNILSGFFIAVRRYAPGAIANTTQVPMIGSAPLAKIYALRVFGTSNTGATSDILAAIDRVLELKALHAAGDPRGLDIQVVNLSLSGPTLDAGHDLMDTAVDRLVESNIVVVDSAGNAGPSAMTIGSPGSSYASLNVGAASLAHNERILRDLQFGSNIGRLFRPFDGPQTAYFSSRGPNPDGRVDPDVTASGFASYGMGFSGTSIINLVSGTSFSTPSVAGVAAVLRQAYPAATARQIRNAIIMSANPTILADGSDINDQGAGYVNAQAAFDLLAAGSVPDTVAPFQPAVRSVAANLERNAGLSVESDAVERHLGPLRPGQRGEILYQVAPNTSRVVIDLTNVTPLNPPEEQNPLFRDEILLEVHSAKTSRQDANGDYLVIAITSGGQFPIEQPEEGILRITSSGVWTNAGDVTADIAIHSEKAPLPLVTRQGRITEHQRISVPVVVPPDTLRMDVRLAWREMWDNYPINDLDLTLIRPDGRIDQRGATLDAPESFTIIAPDPGIWTFLIDGFELHTTDDRYKLRVSLDGVVVR